jgi:heme-degrading protein
MNKTFISSVVLATLTISTNVSATCPDIDRADLIAAAQAIVPGDTYLVPGDGSADPTPNGGFDLPMWVSIVGTEGEVCEVINTGSPLVPGAYIGNQSWLGSRVISAQKANTANAFSLDYYAISTANLFGTVQGNNSLFGLQHSNPVDTYNAYSDPTINTGDFGTSNDPMIGKVVGGVNVFGGGLALYNADGKVGAIGVSGDTSCTDHVVAWKIRNAIGLANVPRGPVKQGQMFNAAGGALVLAEYGVKGDEMYIDGTKIGKKNATGWEHAACPNTPDRLNNAGAIIGKLPTD